jgi:hypothetical protein
MLDTIGKNNAVTAIVDNTPIPRMVCVEQDLDRSCIAPADIPALVRSELECLRERVHPGMRIAVTCGSRGIANIAIITRSIVDFLKSCGAHPFIIPAMGSHGGATAQGQRSILQAYGITEETMGCEVLSSMEVVKVGETEDGFPAYVDKYAYEADGILLCGRVKAHTAFHSDYESGVVKMAVIGLGKQKGAQALHRDGLSQFPTLIPAVARVVFEKVNIIGGLALAENAFDQTFLIEGLRKEEIFEREPDILRRAKTRMGCIFFDDIDVLVVDRMGKDISGLGMDPNVTGRYCVSYMKPTKRVQHLAVLDLTEASHGNCNGIGIADVTTLRLAKKVDLDETYPNAVTSTVLSAIRIPLITRSDKTCIQVALRTCNYFDRENPRIVRIRDTMNLDQIEVSESMLDEAMANEHVRVVGAPHDWPFDESGNLW